MTQEQSNISDQSEATDSLVENASEAISIENVLQDESIPEEKRAQIRQILMVQHQGPIPSPEVINRYEQVLPGAADRIITMAEKSLEQNELMLNQVHEREMEKLQLDKSDNSNERLGMILAFIVALAFGIGGVYLISQGHTVTGTILSGSTIIAVVTALIKGRTE